MTYLLAAIAAAIAFLSICWALDSIYASIERLRSDLARIDDRLLALTQEIRHYAEEEEDE